jgi:hypothetical protein
MALVLKYDTVSEALLPCPPNFLKTLGNNDYRATTDILQESLSGNGPESLGDCIATPPYYVKEQLLALLSNLGNDELFNLRHIRDQLWRAADALQLENDAFVSHVTVVCSLFADEQDPAFISPRRLSLALDSINAPVSADMFQQLVKPFSTLVTHGDLDDQTYLGSQETAVKLKIKEKMANRKRMLPYKALLMLVLRPPRWRMESRKKSQVQNQYTSLSTTASQRFQSYQSTSPEANIDEESSREQKQENETTASRIKHGDQNAPSRLLLSHESSSKNERSHANLPSFEVPASFKEKFGA